MVNRLFRLASVLLSGTALAGTGYVLARVWPEATPRHGGDALRAVAVNGLVFSLFALHHSLFARTRIKRWLARYVPEANQRALYVWMASGLLILTMWAWRPIGHHVYSVPAWARPLLLALQGMGLLAVALAARVIDPLELAGLRAPRATLEVRGPYRWVRHPIYLGVLLIVWAPTEMTGDRLWFAMLTTVYLLVAIPLEERSMQRAVGPPYDAYRARVRWRMLPGAY
jgi:protein-S-isoprenylcysteine O-methyltransferase Ste14